jgi:cholesterol transport system auxiliary component
MRNLEKPKGDYMNTPVKNRRKGWFPLNSNFRGKSAALLVIPSLVAALLLCGCGKPPSLINRYVLAYPPPVLAQLRPLDTAIKVNLFAVDETLNRSEMVYKENPYKTGTYRYNRWRANPGYLATDYLTRDLRDSKLFKAVFSYDQSGQGRFRLEGGVQAFNELDLPGGWQAALTLDITLIDADKENIATRVVFQKTYETQEPMLTKTPQGLAEAMSYGMQKLSKQIIDDVYRAVKPRLGTEKSKEYGAISAKRLKNFSF